MCRRTGGYELGMKWMQQDWSLPMDADMDASQRERGEGWDGQQRSVHAGTPLAHDVELTISSVHLRLARAFLGSTRAACSAQHCT